MYNSLSIHAKAAAEWNKLKITYKDNEDQTCPKLFRKKVTKQLLTN